jgi:hypothetical protein
LPGRDGDHCRRGPAGNRHLAETAFFDYRSSDFQKFLEPWSVFIHEHGRIRGFQYNFSNYNAP